MKKACERFGHETDDQGFCIWCWELIDDERQETP